jgi:hypothetical protein
MSRLIVASSIAISVMAAAAATTVTAGPARAGSAPAESATALSFGPAVELQTPALSYAGETVGGLGCARPGNCVASVSYNDRHGNDQAYLLTLAGGRWRPAIRVKLPSGAGRDPYALVEGITCPHPGDCTGVGQYDTRYGGTRPLALSQVRGRWGRAQQVSPPADAATASDAFLYGVSCTAPGWCESVGGYTDRRGHPQPMAVQEVRGRWRRAVEIRMPADGAPGVDTALFGIACSRPGDCEAVGQYEWKGVQEAAAGVTETAGHWGTAIQIQLPGDASSDQNLPPYSSMYGIACPRPGRCLAIGQYQVKDAYFSMTSAADGRRWAAAAATPAMPRRGFDAELDAISCPAAGFCAAAGFVLSQGPSYPVVLTWNGRRWSRIPAGRVPANGLRGRRLQAGLTDIACPARNWCEAVGWYVTRHARQAMAVTG